MKKQRMTADNVEQLMEIVRSLQQGEEPDMDKIREKTEENRKKALAAQESAVGADSDGAGSEEPLPADSPDQTAESKADKKSAKRNESGRKSAETEKREHSSGRARRKTGAEEKKHAPGMDSRGGLSANDDDIFDEDFEDDEFEQMLNRDVSPEELEHTKEVLAAAASKVSGIFAGLKEMKADRKDPKSERKSGRKVAKKSSVKKSSDRENHEEKPDEAVWKEEESFEKAAAGMNLESETEILERAAEADPEEKESGGTEEIFERLLNSGDEKCDEVQNDADVTEDTSEPEHIPESEKASEQADTEAFADQERKDSSGKPETFTIKRERLVRHHREPERNGKHSDNNSEKASAKVPARTGSGVSAAKAWLLDLRENLSQKGINRREMIMLGAVAVFVILILAMTVNLVGSMLGQRQKSKNVTADAGLSVTIEDEPDSWCNSYPVKLKIKAKNEEIISVSVNGSVCLLDENGMITVEADDWLLDIEVTTSEGIRNARAEIEYLDGDAPVLEINKSENQIILTAVDARSAGVKIYYAATPKTDYLQLPLYQEYTAALAYEADVVYRFYTKDQAGNMSTPVVTTLEDAVSFQLNQTEVSLFPGETYSLGVTAEPEGAMLKNLKYESMDTNVLTVEENGKVTAVGTGTAAVRVSASGLESQICTFEVGSQRTVTVSTIGDCTLGSDSSFNTSVNFDAYAAVNGYDYFFQNVRDIFTQDDVTFANLEGTLTDSTTRENKQYAFKGDQAYTEILTSGSVEVVTLANNHTSDYGEESYEDTKAALTEAGIDYCSGDEIVIREVNGVKTAFIGIYVLRDGMEREAQVKETIARARSQGAKLVIAAFHWGSEKANYPDETQTSLAHTAVDSGADLVVGHHPHVLQGIEKYNGKYIVYSLGNFCFGGNTAPSDRDTIIVRQTFTIDQNGTVTGDDLEIIPCLISTEAGYNTYQPTPVTGEEADRIMGRLNEYSASYGQTYTAAEIL